MLRQSKKMVHANVTIYNLMEFSVFIKFEQLRFGFFNFERSLKRSLNLQFRF